METLLQYERQSSVAISICVMYIARPYMAGFHHVLLLLSNKEGRKWKYELMKSFSFPHTTLGWDESGFSQAKQVWVAPTKIFQEEIQRKVMPIKLWCWTGSSPTAKSVTNGVFVMQEGGKKKNHSALPNKHWRDCRTGSLYFQVIQPPPDWYIKIIPV